MFWCIEFYEFATFLPLKKKNSFPVPENAEYFLNLKYLNWLSFGHIKMEVLFC